MRVQHRDGDELAPLRRFRPWKASICRQFHQRIPHGVSARAPYLRARRDTPAPRGPRRCRSLAGSAISWQNNTLRGTTAFAAELPAGRPNAVEVARYVPAVLAAARTGEPTAPPAPG